MPDISIFDPRLAVAPPYPAGTLVEVAVPGPAGWEKSAAKLSDITAASVAGPAGPPGPQGPLGNPGVIGQTGQIGPTGAPGPQGLPGQTGLQGLTGPVGPQGPAGAAAPATMLQPQTVNWDSNTLVANGTFIALLSAPWTSATILSCVGLCAGGSFTATIQKNGVPVTGLTAVGVSSARASANAAGLNTLATGDSITVTISGMTGSPTNAAIQINIQTSFQ